MPINHVTSTSSPSPTMSGTAAINNNNNTRSVSQILADSLLDSSTSSSPRRRSGPKGASLPSAKQIALRARYNRRVSYDDAAEANVQQLVAESRRLSYNDALPSNSSRLRHFGRYSTTPSTASADVSDRQKKRVSFSEVSSSKGAEEDGDDEEEDDDDEEEYAAFATAAAAGAKASKSRKEIQQQTRRRLSYNDAFEYSSLQTEKCQITSIMKTARRRHTMGDALDYDDDEDGHDSEKCPRRRVSFSSDLVSSVKLIPQITKLQKREMFYRKREIKQFRIDSWLEQALIISDEHYADQVSQDKNSLPPTTKTNSSICQKPSEPASTVSPRKSSLLPSRRTSALSHSKERRSSILALDNATETFFPRETSNSTRGVIRDTGDEDQNGSTDILNDTLRESLSSKKVTKAVHKVDRFQTTLLQTPTTTIDETFKGENTLNTGSSTHDGVPSLSGPFFTSSDIMSAAALAASNAPASSSASAEEKIGDWTESLRRSARSRIDAAIARQGAIRIRNESTSSSSSSSPPSSIPTEVSVSHRRGGRPRMKRRGSIEALAA